MFPTGCVCFSACCSQVSKIIKTHTQVRVEDIEVKALEEREAWTLPNSIFKPRMKESDAHAFTDSAAVRALAQMKEGAQTAAFSRLVRDDPPTQGFG